MNLNWMLTCPMLSSPDHTTLVSLLTPALAHRYLPVPRIPVRICHLRNSVQFIFLQHFIPPSISIPSPSTLTDLSIPTPPPTLLTPRQLKSSVYSSPPVPFHTTALVVLKYLNSVSLARPVSMADERCGAIVNNAVQSQWSTLLTSFRLDPPPTASDQKPKFTSALHRPYLTRFADSNVPFSMLHLLG
jgi:hypothetical protein